MARPERFELPAAGTANLCSIQLSYERAFKQGWNYTLFSKKIKAFFAKIGKFF
jgi:hypothetical protein